MNSAFTKYYFVIILISILFAFFLTISAGFIFCIFLMACLFYMTLANTPTEDRYFVSRIMLAALFLRLIAFIILQYYCFSKGVFDIIGDAADNILRGTMLSDYVMGIRKELTPGFYTYNMHGLTYFNTIFFILFGKDIISLKLINFLCILLSAWLIYDLTRRIYSNVAAKIAMTIVLFWPNIFLWSLTGLKESHVILAITFILWSADKIIFKKGLRRKRLLFILFTILSCFYLVTLRPTSMLQILLICSTIILIYFVFKRHIARSNYKKIRAFFFILLLCFILFPFKEKIFYRVKETYSYIIGVNMGYLSSGGINYNLLGGTDNFYTIKFFLKFLFTSIFHFLSEPLPWNLVSIKMLSYYPLLILWYGILFVAFIGFLKICKIKLQDRIFFPLLFMIIYVVSYGMVVANIGTAIRLRDGIIPILAMLAGCGLTTFKIHD